MWVCEAMYSGGAVTEAIKLSAMMSAYLESSRIAIALPMTS